MSDGWWNFPIRNRTMSFLKTEEEKAKEAKEYAELQLKAKESDKKFKSELEQMIAKCKKDTVVKYALKIMNEREANQDGDVESQTQTEQIYGNKAGKVAKYIKKKESSSLEISHKLSEAASRIEMLAKVLDIKIDLFPEENEPPEYENIRKGVSRFPFSVPFPTLSGEKTSSPTTRKTPQYPESDRLRKLSKQILMSSNSYYNHHLIAENRAFTSDDDPKATPFNFFRMKRIIEFARTLPNDQMKHRYLQQMNDAYIDKDRRGLIYNADGKKVFSATDLFLQQMRKELNRYAQTPQKETSEPILPNKPVLKSESESVEFQSLRQKIITLMLLTFGRLEPVEDIAQERIVEFFRGIMGGGDIKKVRSLVKKPTAHKGTTQSIKLLCNDLNFVRDGLGKLGLNENVRQAVNEIQFLIDDLEKNNEFD